MKKTNTFILLLSLIAATACGNNKPASNTDTAPKKFSITEKPFGTADSLPVTEYTIANPSGASISIINYGGTITKLMVPDKSGVLGDVVLGYNSLQGYQQRTNPYFGALIGRYGNRIAKGKFTLDGKEYTLAGNDHGNSLHGGRKGYDKVVWKAEKLAGDSSLKLTYNSKDGEEGYPGNLHVEVVIISRLVILLGIQIIISPLPLLAQE